MSTSATADPGDDPLRPLRESLKRQHVQAGAPSIREIERLTGRAISHTTAGKVLSCARLPTWGQVEVTVEALGGDVEQFRQLWIQTYEQLHSQATPGQNPSTLQDSSTPEVPRMRRRAVITAAGLLGASAAGVLGYTAWPRITGKGADPAVLIEQDFGASLGGWPVGEVEHGVQRYVPGAGYHVNTTTGDSPVWVAAPFPGQAVDTVRLTATATVRAGNSGWGVWFHNTITGTRYEFSLTHDGYAYIKIHDGPAEPSWEPVLNFFPGQKNEVVAECRTTAQGVQLDMIINDRPRPGRLHQNQLLGRGTVGVHAFHFKPKKKADIQFHHFVAARL